jgi:hypothetical protein
MIFGKSLVKLDIVWIYKNNKALNFGMEVEYAKKNSGQMR